MKRGACLGAMGALCLLGLSGCPLTDDYFVESGAAAASRAGVGGTESSVAPGGSAGASTLAGGAAAGGDSDPGGSGAPGAGGELAQPCVPSTERCNGHDDDCDGFRDEAACGALGAFGCFGFTLSDRDDHGYMLCSAIKLGFDDAQQACAAQDMRLAWIESEAENSGLAAKVNALGGATEFLVGATDQGLEGDWYWAGGSLFWRGAANGAAVGDAFEAWADSSPNNMGNEDCLLYFPASQVWGDRICSAAYAYLCEELEPGE